MTAGCVMCSRTTIAQDPGRAAAAFFHLVKGGTEVWKSAQAM